jgi:hypothetical protein
MEAHIETWTFNELWLRSWKSSENWKLELLSFDGCVLGCVLAWLRSWLRFWKIINYEI